MTTPKKPLSKTESAIQLGNVLKYGARGGSTKAGILSKIKKLLVKSKVIKSSSKIGEVQTRPKKSLQNQKVSKEILESPAFKKAQKEMGKPTPSGYGYKKNPNKKERELEKRFQQHKLRMKKK